MLSDSEASEVESLHHLTINQHYAKAFEYKKEREELQKRLFPLSRLGTAVDKVDTAQ